MQSFNVQETVTAWSPLAETLFVPHTEEEYNRLVAMLDELIDEVGEDETHPLASLVTTPPAKARRLLMPFALTAASYETHEATFYVGS